jgi:hypothetical protein
MGEEGIAKRQSSSEPHENAVPVGDVRHLQQQHSLGGLESSGDNGIVMTCTDYKHNISKQASFLNELSLLDSNVFKRCVEQYEARPDDHSTRV